MKNITEDKFIKSLEDGYKSYLGVHARSNTKITPMHKCISEILLEKLGQGYSVKSLGIDAGKEYKFEGRYYDKDLDISVFKNSKPVSAISFKFITSNYKQNSNNYFENMLGETVNVRRGNLLYAQMLVVKHKMPYFSTDKKIYEKIEKINDTNLDKYIKLEEDNVSGCWHKPDMLFLKFIETGDEARVLKAVFNKENITKSIFHKDELLPLVKVSFMEDSELEKSFNQKNFNFLKKNGDIDNFLEAFVNLTKGRSYNV